MFKNISILVSASAAAQVLTVLSLPILSRLFDDTSFGIFQIYISTLNMLLMIAAMRYEMAILAANTKFRYRNLVKIVFRLILFMSGLSVVFCFVLWPFLYDWLGNLVDLLYFIPFMILVGGGFYAITHIVIREQEYKISAKSKLVQAMSYVLFGILLGLGKFSVFGLVLADLISKLISSLWLLLKLPQIGKLMFRPLNWAHAKLVAFRFKDYPIYALPGSLMSASIGLLVPLTFFAMYDLSVAGQYAIVERFVLLPVGVIAAAAGQVFTGDFSKQARINDTNLNETFRYIVFKLFLIGIFPTLVLYLAGPEVVPFLFGSQWGLAGEICRIAAPIALVRLVAGPVHMAIVACGRQGLQLTWEVSRFLLTLALFLIVMYLDFQNPLDVMRIYVLSVVISYISFLILADRVTKKRVSAIQLKFSEY
jgi:O-antigen/teichoic acid export membrane protein